MKKQILSILLVLILVCSCATADNTSKNNEITMQDAVFAVQSALEYAIDASSEKTLEYYRTNLFYLTKEYAVLPAVQNEIPGIKNMLQKWTVFINDFISTNLPAAFADAKNLLMKGNIPDVFALVYESEKGITEHFSKNYFDAVRKIFYDALLQLDISALNNAVSQYNSWVTVNIYKENRSVASTLPPAEKENICLAMSKEITTIFFKNMGNAEELYRTTPNPYLNSRISKVFNIY